MKQTNYILKTIMFIVCSPINLTALILSIFFIIASRANRYAHKIEATLQKLEKARIIKKHPKNALDNKAIQEVDINNIKKMKLPSI